MTITVWPADAVAGAPAYSGRKLRQVLGALASGATAARPLGGFSGVRVGSGVVGSATSTTWTIKPHAGQLDLEAASEAGPYWYSIDANVTGAVTAADANNPRVDIVYVTLNDPAEGDGSAKPAVTTGYLAGAPAAGPVAPAVPARSLTLFTISVPKVGGGAPTVSMVAPEVGAAGSPLGVRSAAQRDALVSAPFVGQQVRRIDLAGRIETWDGSGFASSDAQIAALQAEAAKTKRVSTTLTSSGGGHIAIPHGLPGTPAGAVITMHAATGFGAGVVAHITNIDANVVTAQVFNNSGAAVVNTALRASMVAWL